MLRSAPSALPLLVAAIALLLIGADANGRLFGGRNDGGFLRNMCEWKLVASNRVHQQSFAACSIVTSAALLAGHGRAACLPNPACCMRGRLL